MKKALERIFEKYGTELTVVGEEKEKAVRGFFRAVNSKSWQSMESEATLLGEISRGQYAYLGPADAGVREGDSLRVGEREYLFRRVEVYRYRDQVLYQWGMCVEKGVNDTWGTRS